MENFIVSARKYRPSTFDMVVGQSHITDTLKNAIQTNQLAQAYLFCGPRGVGKTTCARIFAKAINCESVSRNGEPCNECDSCKDFNNGTSMNIFELDAASNNSVDDIRSLVEGVRIPPQSGRYKVYIIDEVHQLSASAFNAFLKTLEEPPSWVKFILATTEKHKIMPTILSRCQCFDFKRITNEDIVNQLQYVADQEGVKADKESLNLIAQHSDGGMRDALSTFDQMVNFCSGNLEHERCAEALNILGFNDYYELIGYMRTGNFEQAMLLWNRVQSRGVGGQYFLTGLCEYIRNLLVAHDVQTHQLLDMSDESRKRFVEQSQACGVPFMLKMLDMASDFDYRYPFSTNKRLHVEVCLMKICAIVRLSKAEQ